MGRAVRQKTSAKIMACAISLCRLDLSIMIGAYENFYKGARAKSRKTYVPCPGQASQSPFAIKNSKAKRQTAANNYSRGGRLKKSRRLEPLAI